MLKLTRDSVGMLQDTVEYQPMLLDHSTSTIIVNSEVFNAMCDHTRVGHVIGRCGGIDSESAEEKSWKERAAANKTIRNTETVEFEAVGVVVRVDRVEDGGISQ